eukprot:6248584-Alexandrium_andersonii.AAC.1
MLTRVWSRARARWSSTGGWPALLAIGTLPSRGRRPCRPPWPGPWPMGPIALLAWPLRPFIGTLRSSTTTSI